jgi:hypothetical protein
MFLELDKGVLPTKPRNDNSKAKELGQMCYFYNIVLEDFGGFMNCNIYPLAEDMSKDCSSK